MRGQLVFEKIQTEKKQFVTAAEPEAAVDIDDRINAKSFHKRFTQKSEFKQ